MAAFHQLARPLNVDRPERAFCDVCLQMEAGKVKTHIVIAESPLQQSPIPEVSLQDG
jgi:hypothetical protein